MRHFASGLRGLAAPTAGCRLRTVGANRSARRHLGLGSEGPAIVEEGFQLGQD